MKATKSLLALALAGGLLGCTAGGTPHLGADGSLHPDATAGIAGYTGQGDGGQGWAGDSDGEGGPSAEQPVADDRTPR
jgi:hypothetical protein